jgi:hypothetical protein
MAKTATIKVTNCIRCPFASHQIIGDWYTCQKCEDRLVPRTKIPKWCPLPEAKKGK